MSERSSRPHHMPRRAPAPLVRKIVHLRWRQRITPYTPRHNGKVERYDRTLSEEFLSARTWTSEQQRSAALTVWNVHYQPPVTRLHGGVTNVMASDS